MGDMADLVNDDHPADDGTANDILYLQCVECGFDLIPPDGRAADSADGLIEHAENCRCGKCDWVWNDDTRTYPCPECDTVNTVHENDGSAVTREVKS